MKRLLAIAISAMFAFSACNASATLSPAATTTAPSAAAASAPAASGGASAAPAASASAAPLAVDPAEAVIKNVEPNAEIGFWTFYLSPTFDPFIKETIARFQGTYPGVKVDWEDHQA